MPTNRATVKNYLDNLRTTLANMGVDINPPPVWIVDQLRASACSELVVRDESHVLALLAGMFVSSNATLLCYGPSVGYLAMLVNTVESLLPLLDDPTGPLLVVDPLPPEPPLRKHHRWLPWW